MGADSAAAKAVAEAVGDGGTPGRAPLTFAWAWTPWILVAGRKVVVVLQQCAHGRASEARAIRMGPALNRWAARPNGVHTDVWAWARGGEGARARCIVSERAFSGAAVFAVAGGLGRRDRHAVAAIVLPVKRARRVRVGTQPRPVVATDGGTAAEEDSYLVDFAGPKLRIGVVVLWSVGVDLAHVLRVDDEIGVDVEAAFIRDADVFARGVGARLVLCHGKMGLLRSEHAARRVEDGLKNAAWSVNGERCLIQAGEAIIHVVTIYIPEGDGCIPQWWPDESSTLGVGLLLIDAETPWFRDAVRVHERQLELATMSDYWRAIRTLDAVGGDVRTGCAARRQQADPDAHVAPRAE
eukprot:4365722-Prymnesium_polylepis.1